MIMCDEVDRCDKICIFFKVQLQCSPKSIGLASLLQPGSGVFSCVDASTESAAVWGKTNRADNTDNHGCSKSSAIDALRVPDELAANETYSQRARVSHRLLFRKQPELASVAPEAMWVM